MDDMLLKSRTAEHHITNLEKTFMMLQHFHMKLNFNNCAFGITSDKFLGFVVLEHKIKANAEKIPVL